jgi:predicted ATPase
VYRYEAVFILDPLDDFTSADDLVWAKEREVRRVHELIVQGYYDTGYRPIFVPADEPARRVEQILANISASRGVRATVRPLERGPDTDSWAK